MKLLVVFSVVLGAGVLAGNLDNAVSLNQVKEEMAADENIKYITCSYDCHPGGGPACFPYNAKAIEAAEYRKKALKILENVDFGLKRKELAKALKFISENPRRLSVIVVNRDFETPSELADSVDKKILTCNAVGLNQLPHPEKLNSLREKKVVKKLIAKKVKALSKKLISESNWQQFSLQEILDHLTADDTGNSNGAICTEIPSDPRRKKLFEALFNGKHADALNGIEVPEARKKRELSDEEAAAQPVYNPFLVNKDLEIPAEWQATKDEENLMCNVVVYNNFGSLESSINQKKRLRRRRRV